MLTAIRSLLAGILVAQAACTASFSVGTTKDLLADSDPSGTEQFNVAVSVTGLSVTEELQIFEEDDALILSVEITTPDNRSTTEEISFTEDETRGLTGDLSLGNFYFLQVSRQPHYQACSSNHLAWIFP